MQFSDLPRRCRGPLCRVIRALDPLHSYPPCDGMSSFAFSPDDIDRASRYHRPRYCSLAAGMALSAAVYATLAWSPPGRSLWRIVQGLGWAGAAGTWAALVVVIAAVVQLPLAHWQGLSHGKSVV